MPMTPPHAGKLKHRLRFERRDGGSNVGGVVKYGWTPIDGLVSVSASVEPTRGGEETIAGRMASKVSYDIWARSSAALRGLLATDRAVNARTGEIYNLAPAIDPPGRRQWLFFQAVSAGNANGQG